MHEDKAAKSVARVHKMHPEVSGKDLFAIFQICRETLRMVEMFAFDAVLRKYAYSALIDAIMLTNNVDMKSVGISVSPATIADIGKSGKGTITLDGVDYEFKLGEDE